MEYIIIIAFLIMIIPFWIIINRQSGITGRIKTAFGVLSAGILRIPQGLFYSKNHTWTHLEKSGDARVGLDDLLLHITGEVKLNYLRNPGETVNKGDMLAEINQNGKILKISSPISGVILDTNPEIDESPNVLNNDPYGEGWIYTIKPSKWVSETNSYYLADEAIAWSRKELIRFKDFLAMSMEKYSPETSMVILQDGGELCDKPLSELPDKVWQDFQKTFLN